jgi:hypothetical protein
MSESHWTLVLFLRISILFMPDPDFLFGHFRVVRKKAATEKSLRTSESAGTFCFPSKSQRALVAHACNPRYLGG